MQSKGGITMNDREIFRDNLNYYLNKYDKLQKDLADYVGAKKTTVSGWTRGISYPRADAMEKIAMFFGFTYFILDKNFRSRCSCSVIIRCYHFHPPQTVQDW